MQIICTTTAAAAQVLHSLLNASLQPIRDFEIRPVLSTTPPITYTLNCALTNEQMTQIRAITDTTVVG
jgi:hypothetical protein